MPKENYYRKGNNYTGAYGKETRDQFVTNEITALTDTDIVDFWAADVNKGRLSPIYQQKLGMVQDIYFNNYQTIGTQIRLGMQNGRLSLSYAFVSGRADLR